MKSLVLYEVEDGVATVTLNRPDRLNTMTDALLEEALAALEEAAGSETTRVVILTGAGRAFCAGGDLAEGVGGGVGGQGSIPNASSNLRRFMRTAQLLHEMPKPTIAAIRGACAGAGLSLACAADLRYAGSSAVFNAAFVSAGLSGDFGGTWTLTRIVGTGRAREAYLLSERFNAMDAERIGLVSRVIPDDELMPHVREVALRLAASPPIALRLAKQNLNDALRLSFAEALEAEAVRHISSSRTEDAREATAAFLEKRPPVFQGR